MISELWQWAHGNLPIPAIWSHQDGDQPPPPYATLDLISSTRTGLPYYGPPDDVGVIQIDQGQLMTLSVQTWGAGSTDDIQTLRDSLERITVQRSLRSSGFAYVRVLSGPQDVPEITGTTWQKRAVMDVQFRTNRRVPDDVGLIETVAKSGGDGNASQTDALIGGA